MTLSEKLSWRSNQSFFIWWPLTITIATNPFLEARLSHCSTYAASCSQHVTLRNLGDTHCHISMQVSKDARARWQGRLQAALIRIAGE
jgi:hypothetical protein